MSGARPGRGRSRRLYLFCLLNCGTTCRRRSWPSGRRRSPANRSARPVTTRLGRCGGYSCQDPRPARKQARKPVPRGRPRPETHGRRLGRARAHHRAHPRGRRHRMVRRCRQAPARRARASRQGPDRRRTRARSPVTAGQAATPGRGSPGRSGPGHHRHRVAGRRRGKTFLPPADSPGGCPPPSCRLGGRAGQPRCHRVV